VYKKQGKSKEKVARKYETCYTPYQILGIFSDFTYLLSLFTIPLSHAHSTRGQQVIYQYWYQNIRIQMRTR
jgi:hypothetical protein